MKKRKRLSGFTLLELVIVMAIFSAIAVGALAMIRPAMQLFHKTSAQEEAAADIDNISRYIQDNLRYADRVNIYYGYGETDVDAMISKSISGKYNCLEFNLDNGNWESKDYETSPFKFFRDYYYGSPDEYARKKVNVMEITTDGKVSIFSVPLDAESVKTTEISSVNKEFYENSKITLNGLNCSSPNMNITLSVGGNDVNEGTDNNKTVPKQEVNITLTFINIALRSEFNVIQKDTSDKENSITRPANAYKDFSIKKEDANGNKNTEFNGGNIYILYTVPEIIIP